MKFTDILNKAYFLASTNSTDFPSGDSTRAINTALEKVAALIMEADQTWQWDDANQTDLPIATTTITNAQQDYAIATAHHRITEVEAKDSDGNWYHLDPFDQHEVKTSLTDFMEGGGFPRFYDKIGNSIFLYPIPDYTQASSLKIYFQRVPISFIGGSGGAAGADDDDSPGFSALYHELVALYAAYEYCVSVGNNSKLSILRPEIAVMEKALQDFYGTRNKDERLIMRFRTNNPR